MYHSELAVLGGHYTLDMGIEKDEDFMVFIKKYAIMVVKKTLVGNQISFLFSEVSCCPSYRWPLK